MKKIIFLTSSFPDSTNKAQGVFIYYRVQELLKKGIDVEVWLMHSLLKGFKKQYSIQISPEDRVIKVHIFNSLKIPNTYIWFGYHRIKKIIEKKNFDLIQIHFAWDGWLAHKLTKRLKIPYVLTCHGSDIHTFPDKYKLFHKWTKMFFKSASGVIFVSEYLKKLAEEKGFYTESTTVIPNGINLMDFYPDQAIINNPRKILYIGNLFKIKGVDLLPAIIRETLRISPESEFQIVGEGPLRPMVERELATEILNKKVVVSGAVGHEQIPIILNSCKMLIIPSRMEGFSIVAIEARACGIPVVATKTGGLPSAVESGGMLVNPGPDIVNRFAIAINKIQNQTWDKQLLSFETQKFRWDKTISDEISFYNRISSNKEE